MKLTVEQKRLVITSSITKTELEQLEKFTDNGGAVLDDKGNEVYRVSFNPNASTCGNSSLLKKTGVIFNDVTADGELALFIDVPGPAADTRKLIKEDPKMVRNLAALEQNEAKLKDAVADRLKDTSAIIDMLSGDDE